MIRPTRTVLACAAAALLVFAAACGGDDDTPEPPGPVNASPSGPSSSQTVPTRPVGTTVPVTVVIGGDTTVVIATAPDGPYLTDAQGLTLYTSANDSPDSGRASCVASCASLWPPLTVDGAPIAPEGLSGTLGVISRRDDNCGQGDCPEISQVTYNGLPLYRYINDQQPGDRFAMDLGEVWSIVRP